VTSSTRHPIAKKAGAFCDGVGSPTTYKRK
jgi:hypothetical protein